MLEYTPTVYVIDDNASIAESLADLFKSAKLNVEIFLSAEKFITQFDLKQQGCLVVDIRMPGMSGLDLQKEMLNKNNHMPIIFITAHGDIPMAVKALKEGAFDFFTKPFNSQLLLERVQQALAYDIQLTSEYKKLLTSNLIYQLTRRETEVMELIIAGKINKQISNELGISVSTVEMHRANLMEKMQAKSLVELVKNYFVFKRKIRFEN